VAEPQPYPSFSPADFPATRAAAHQASRLAQAALERQPHSNVWCLPVNNIKPPTTLLPGGLYRDARGGAQFIVLPRQGQRAAVVSKPRPDAA